MVQILGLGFIRFPYPLRTHTLAGMNRTSGLVALAIGALLTFMLVFTTFTHAVKSWEIDPATGDVSQVTIACAAPLRIVFGDAEQQANPSWGAHLCASTGQRLFIQGVAVFAVALGLGVRGIRKGPRPKRKPIDSIPAFGEPGNTGG